MTTSTHRRPAGCPKTLWLLLTATVAACGGGGGGGGGSAAPLAFAAGLSDQTAASQAPVAAAPAASAPASAPAPAAALAPAPAPAAASSAALMPTFDSALIPTKTDGYSTERVRSTRDLPRPSDGIGAFRTVCDYSHMASDDPLVYPGQPGRSHLHVFFGNTGVDGNSTPDSVANSGNSTCRGGTVNRSAYWVPSMIDTKDGRPLRPAESHFYYKTGYLGILPGNVRSIPARLRMIAGDPSNTSARGPFSYTCTTTPNAPASFSIPNCAAGGELWQHIVFPQCWDGVNLDSPDHKSHMAYATAGRGCPSSHPVALPEITFNIVYPVTEANAPRRWRLSSDNYSSSQPGGYSAHADWMNGWRDDIMDTFIANCDRTAVDCASSLLGDGREIY